MTCVVDFSGSYTNASCDGSCTLDPARVANTHVGDCQPVGSNSTTTE